MKILLSGVETNNKGAELMLYAILQEIERKYPDAEVFIPADRIRQGADYVKTSLKLRLCQNRFVDRAIGNLHINGILRRLHLPQIIPQLSIPNGINYFLDGSGFAFSDQQWTVLKKRVDYWHILLKILWNQKTRIIFLPQAFGPAEFEETKKVFSFLNKYANFIVPREKVSYSYIEKSGRIDMDKVKIFPDFTSLVNGVFPKKFEHLKNGICIIPNMKMIDKGLMSKSDYKMFIFTIIDNCKKTNNPIYLLNHEGKGDEELALELSQDMSGSIEVVTGLNALEVKGLIATAYVVISSRFHGVASALNSCVPCLATSWSHKYKELFADYMMYDSILPLNNLDKAVQMVENYLSSNNNFQIRTQIAAQVSKIKRQTREMWEWIWNDTNYH